MGSCIPQADGLRLYQREVVEDKPACQQASSIPRDFYPTCMTSLSDIIRNCEPVSSKCGFGQDICHSNRSEPQWLAPHFQKLFAVVEKHWDWELMSTRQDIFIFQNFCMAKGSEAWGSHQQFKNLAFAGSTHKNANCIYKEKHRNNGF